MVSHPSFDVDPAGVVIRSEVAESGELVGQQLPDGDEDGSGNRDEDCTVCGRSFAHDRTRPLPRPSFRHREFGPISCCSARRYLSGSGLTVDQPERHGDNGVRLATAPQPPTDRSEEPYDRKVQPQAEEAVRQRSLRTRRGRITSKIHQKRRPPEETNTLQFRRPAATHGYGCRRTWLYER